MSGDALAPEVMELGRVPYADILQELSGRPLDEVTVLLMEELPDIWWDSYEEMTRRETDIISFRTQHFYYLFDCFPSMAKDHSLRISMPAKPRVVVAYGCSAPRNTKRDDYRLRGWLGPTGERLGPGWDKGHFIAHAIGGDVDRNEVNVFPHRRHLNRGWSSQGKRFRQMEKECASSPGIFCFHRPLYSDSSMLIPTFLEFGLLRPNGELWVERFDNR